MLPVIITHAISSWEAAWRTPADPTLSMGLLSANTLTYGVCITEAAVARRIFAFFCVSSQIREICSGSMMSSAFINTA